MKCSHRHGAALCQRAQDDAIGGLEQLASAQCQGQLRKMACAHCYFLTVETLLYLRLDIFHVSSRDYPKPIVQRERNSLGSSRGRIKPINEPGAIGSHSTAIWQLPPPCWTA